MVSSYDILSKASRFQRRVVQVTHPTSTLKAIPYWGAAVLVGFMAYAYNKAFLFTGAIVNKIFDHSPYLFLLIAPACFFTAWWLVHRFSPGSAGSGIPQVMAANALYTEDKKAPLDRLLGLKAAAIKVVSSLIILLGGGAIGREGPTIQIGASLFHFMGRVSHRFFPPQRDEAWIVAGGAAGIAAAFNTPLGGIIFAVEELMTIHFNRVKTALISAVIIAGFIAQWLSGPYLYLGFPKVAPIAATVFWLAIVVGLVSGLAGATFGRLLFSLLRLRRKIKGFWRFGLVAALAGVILTCLAIALDRRAFGSGAEVMTGLLFEGDVADWKLLAARFFGSIITYIAGAAGGIFAPSLTIGATIGSWLSVMAKPEHQNLMILMGMVSFLAAMTRAPFTSFVLVLEMTDRHSVIFPIMLAAIVAYGAARLIDSHSFYWRTMRFYMDEHAERQPVDRVVS